MQLKITFTCFFILFTLNNIFSQFNISAPCNSNNTLFVVTDFTNVDSVAWQFGDASQIIYSKNDSIIHKYNLPGNYNVSCTKYSSLGPDVYQETIAIFQSVIADFSWNNVCLGANTFFQDKSKTYNDPIASYYWRFSDSTFSSDKNPSHLYKYHGVFNVFLTVTTQNGCIDSINYNSVKVFLNPIVAINNINDATCFGYCDGSANAYVVGNSAPYSYLWNDENNQTTAIATGLCANNYNLFVTDVNNCKANSSFEIKQNKKNLISSYATQPSCNGKCDGKAFVTVSSIYTPLSYKWNSSILDTNNLSDLCSGDYTITITDSENCSDSVFLTVPISEFIPFLEINSDNNGSEIEIGTSVIINATENSNYTYSWQPSELFSDNLIHSQEVKPYFTTSYSLTITDNKGCTNSKSIDIVVKKIECKEPYVFVPNAFSPNGDNNNDVLFVRGDYLINEFSLFIYNYNGEKVFETTDISIGWDGTNKGKTLEPGVFLYVLEAVCVGGEVYKKQGNITLLR